MYRNVVTEMSPHRIGQTKMRRDRNGADRNGLTESARPKRPARIDQTETSRNPRFSLVRGCRLTALRAHSVAID